MLQKLLKYPKRIVLVVLLVALLALVRAFEEILFYDPLLQYFKNDYQSQPFPDVDKVNLFLNLLFRYFLNTILSLAIIQVIFIDMRLTKFASILYVVFFILLAAIFFSIITFRDQPDTLFIFYVRRFLIQPIFLLLFIPAFFYQQNQKRESA